MKIAVGSQNPVKIKAVELAMAKIWPNETIEVISVDVPSGISDQPLSHDEAIIGATNRAKLALEKLNTDFGIGLEGNIVDNKHGMFLSGWVVVIDKTGKIGLSGGGCTLMPNKIAIEIRKGQELGPTMDKFLGDHNTKQKQGTIGVLTNNLIPRTDSFEKAVICAFARFMNPELYDL